MNPFILFLIQLNFVIAARKLEFVQAIWRHGDRAPLHLPYPNDQYTERAWPRGWGQLTSIGMQQLHELGEYFRYNYIDNGFISSNFSVKEVYLRSSDSDRALTSAQSFLYGMYPASNLLQWNGDINWQPIPVHASSPGEPDLVCKATSVDCPRHDKLVEEGDLESKSFFDEKYSDLFAALSTQTGLPKCNYLDINGLFDVQRELIHNMTERQPKWVFQKWPQYQNRESMDIITEMRTVRMTNVFDTEEKSRLMGGSVLNVFLNNAVAASQSRNDHKMLLYSSHDGVLLALLNAFRAGNELMVPYASALIMHVYSENKEYFAELYYRNDTTVDAYRIPFPRCHDPCKVDELSKAYANMTVQSLTEMMNLCGSPLKLCSISSIPSVNLLLVFVILINIF